MEIRAYLICFSDLTESESEGGDLHDLTDNEWIGISERQGFVYSLQGFAENYNAEAINEVDTIMRFINPDNTCDHSFIDEDNEGIYGNEVCRFCGEEQEK